MKDIRFSRRGLWWTGWLVLLGFAVVMRWAYWHQSPIVSRDGTWYIECAEAMASGDVESGRATRQEPVYPALLIAAERGLSALGVEGSGRWVLSGVVLGTLGSVVLTVLVYVIGKEVFGEASVGWLAAVFTALVTEITELSADVMTEPVFLMWVALGVMLFLLALKRGKVVPLVMAALCGVAVGLSFLTRKEGLASAGVFLVFLLLPGVGLTWRRRAVIAVGGLTGFGVCIGAYALAGGGFEWLDLYRRQWVSQASTVPVRSEAVVLAKTLEGGWDFVWEPVHRWLKLCNWPVAVAAMGYMSVRREYATRRKVLLLAGLAVIYLAVVYVHIAGKAFLVGRYILPAVVMTMPIGAAVVMRIVAAARRGVSEERQRVVAGAILAGFCVVGLVSTVTPRSGKDLTILDAARWIRETTPKDACIFTFERRIPFYAGRRQATYAPERYNEGTWRRKHSKQADLVVFYQHRNETWMKEKFFDLVGRSDFELVKRFSRPEAYPVEVYRPK